MSAVKMACCFAISATVIGVVLARMPGLDKAALIQHLGSAMTPIATSRQAPSGLPLAAGSWSASPASHESQGNSLVLMPDRYGQYATRIDVEGRQVAAVVDTGATFVSLSAQAAATLGFRPAPAEFNVPMNTANGITYVAIVDIPELHVGSLSARHVRAIVQRPGTLDSGALLGMSFLRGLSGFATRGDRLVLRQ